MTSLPASSSLPLSAATVLGGIPSVKGQAAGLAGTDVRPNLCATVYNGQDPMDCVKAAGRGPEGIIGDSCSTASRDHSQWLNLSYQTFCDSHGIRDTSNPNPLVFNIPLPPSLELARLYAEHPNCQRNCQRSVPAPPPSAEVAADERDQTLAALRQLANWLRLRNVLLPEPVVGDPEGDPAGLIDRLGVKGLSVYSAFIDMEDLRCRICGHISDTIDTGIHHQRHMRHLQA